MTSASNGQMKLLDPPAQLPLQSSGVTEAQPLSKDIKMNTPKPELSKKPARDDKMSVHRSVDQSSLQSSNHDMNGSMVTNGNQDIAPDAQQAANKEVQELEPKGKKRKRISSSNESDAKIPKKSPATASSSKSNVSKSKRRAASPGSYDPSVERPRNVETVIYGRYQIGTWYYSPYPSEYGDKMDKLYICEHCLKYASEDDVMRAHKLHCKKRRPPGRVIYQQGNIKVYEIDGKEHKLYCQNLCLMSKLFLETKTLYYDVEGFKFYVLTEQDRTLDMFAGYFSKEKISYDNYNLACIMVLPPYQRKGYGRLLIELSYELSKHEGVIGSPEKPLSNLGALGYRSYWSSTLVAALKGFRGQLSIQELSNQTGIHPDDIISTLTELGFLRFWKKELAPLPDNHNSEQEILPNDTPRGVVQVCITPKMLDEAVTRHHLRLERKVDPSLIKWN